MAHDVAAGLPVYASSFQLALLSAGTVQSTSGSRYGGFSVGGQRVTQNSGLSANYLVNSPVKNDVRRWDLKSDVNLSSKDNVFWRLSKMDTENPAVLPLPVPAWGGEPYDLVTEGHNTGATRNHIRTSNLLMTVRAGNPANIGDREIVSRPDFKWDFSALKDFQAAERVKLQFSLKLIW